MALKEQLTKELADMQAKRDSFMQSYWQADGACQALAGILKIMQADEAANVKPDENPQPAAG